MQNAVKGLFIEDVFADGRGKLLSDSEFISGDEPLAPNRPWPPRPKKHLNGEPVR